MAEEKIMTLHPAGKRGVRISLEKYKSMREEILAVLAEESLPFMAMAKVIEQRIGNRFDGSVSWYAVAVTQDLKARGKVHTVPKTRPPQLTIGKAD